jgi:uncharacterized tellurite resistance protein B-like protein
MGLFDKVFSSAAPSVQNEGYKPLSDYEAWVAILYAAISVDGEVSDVEIDAMTRLLLFKNKFANIDIVPFYKNALLASTQYGTQHLIDKCCQLVKEQDRPTILALVAELVLSDGLISEKEKELLEYIATRLNIPESDATKIMEVILIKNKDNRILVN